MDDDVRRELTKKYQRGIDQLISKYINQIDDEFDVIDVLNSEEEQTFLLEEISFIKSSKAPEKMPHSKLFLFNDIYKMLCQECNFDDLYLFLK